MVYVGEGTARGFLAIGKPIIRGLKNVHRSID